MAGRTYRVKLSLTFDVALRKASLFDITHTKQGPTNSSTFQKLKLELSRKYAVAGIVAAIEMISFKLKGAMNSCGKR